MTSMWEDRVTHLLAGLDVIGGRIYLNNATKIVPCIDVLQICPVDGVERLRDSIPNPCVRLLFLDLVLVLIQIVLFAHLMELGHNGLGWIEVIVVFRKEFFEVYGRLR